jgi:hypothetical protein
MMKIDRNNYEAYLLDLLEGRLTAEEERLVRDFLLLHPDCAGPAADLAPWVLEQRERSFPDREKLKKHLPHAGSELTDTNFDLFSIARLEHDLSPEQEKIHESLVAGDDTKKQEWNAWQRTKLIPPRVVFPGKRRLKRREGTGGRIIWISMVSAAAAVALLVTLLTTDRGTLGVPDPGPAGGSVAAETPSGEAVKQEPLQEEVPVAVRESERLASEPVTLSIKKNPDPPELTGMDKGGKQRNGTSVKSSLPQAEPGDTVSRAGRGNNIHERMRIAGLDNTAADIYSAGIYDRIAPLELPPGSIHLSNISIKQLSAIDLQQVFDDFTEENEISLWSIANSGIRGLNRITGADISLLAYQDPEGDISGIRLKSRRFSFSTPVHGEE